MKKFIMIVGLVSLLFADTNATKETNTIKKDVAKKSAKKVMSKKEILDKQLKKQMEREEKYSKEQKFYMGKDYNLKDKEIDKDSLKHLDTIEPDYDFDITDVYRDDI